MKMLLIVIALLMAVETKSYQKMFYDPNNIQNVIRENNLRGPWIQWRQNQNNIFGSDVEWVCQNPKTKDMMIIAADNTQYHPDRRWQNVQPGHQRHQQGHNWPQPIVIVEERPDNNQIISPSNPLNNDNNNNDNQPQTTPHYHGGEGLIDVRIGV